MRVVISVIGMLLVATLANLSAQRAQIQTGVLVRVTAPECGLYRQPGTLRSAIDETLVLAYGDSSVQCLRANITRLERSQGRSGNAAIGAILGVVGGAALGAVVQGISNSGWCVAQSLDEHCTYSAVTQGVLVGGLAGLVAGGLIGSAFKSELWGEIPLPSLSISLTPLPGRFGLRVSSTF